MRVEFVALGGPSLPKVVNFVRQSLASASPNSGVAVFEKLNTPLLGLACMNWTGMYIWYSTDDGSTILVVLVGSVSWGYTLVS